MFRCDRGCDEKFEKFGNFVETKHTLQSMHCSPSKQKELKSTKLITGRDAEGNNGPLAFPPARLVFFSDDTGPSCSCPLEASSREAHVD